MNKEWLSDYDAHEKEEYQKFLKDFHKSGKIEYPAKSRFRKLSNPIVETTSNIWSIIPFYGSSFVHVFPSNSESTIRTCGWGTDADINNLIQLAKDTGRVQFVLSRSAIEYEHHDYLEPILKELRPPVLELIPDLIFDKNRYKKSQLEFTTLSGHKFVPLLKAIFDHFHKLEDVPGSFEGFYQKYVLNYATLKLSGYSEIADDILNALVDDPNLALHYLNLYGVILADPKQSSLKLSYNPIFSIEAKNLRSITREISKLRNNTLGVGANLKEQVRLLDVGELLIKKLTAGTEGYLGCQSLIDMYKQHDLQKLLVSIENGIKREKIDTIKSDTLELSTLLDNLWNDAKISRLSRGISFGVPLLLGTVGPLAAQQIGGIGGILAGLGFRAFDKKITPLISDRLARIFRSNYLVAIYDFKKKYNIKE